MCKLCDKKEDMTHLFISCKRNKKIWKDFQKYYKCLTQKEHTPLQHILTHSATPLPSKTKKLCFNTNHNYSHPYMENTEPTTI